MSGIRCRLEFRRAKGHGLGVVGILDRKAARQSRRSSKRRLEAGQSSYAFSSAVSQRGSHCLEPNLACRIAQHVSSEVNSWLFLSTCHPQFLGHPNQSSAHSLQVYWSGVCAACPAGWWQWKHCTRGGAIVKSKPCGTWNLWCEGQCKIVPPVKENAP